MYVCAHAYTFVHLEFLIRLVIHFGHVFYLIVKVQIHMYTCMYIVILIHCQVVLNKFNLSIYFTGSKWKILLINLYRSKRFPKICTRSKKRFNMYVL